MGRFGTVLVTPPGRDMISQETFHALAAELLRANLVALPGVVLAGRLKAVNSLFYVTNVVWRRTTDAEVAVVSVSDDPAALLQALEQAAYSQVDVCLWFTGLNHQHPALLEWGM